MVGSAGIVTVIALAILQGGQPISAELAWQGAVTGDAISELAVHAMTRLDANIALELDSAGVVVAAEFFLPGRDSTPARLPVIVDESGKVSLKYRIDGSAWQALEVGHFERGDGPVIVVGYSATNALRDIPDKTVIDPEDLPTLLSAYTHVAALVMSKDALVSIDELQLRGLLEHVGACGRLLLIDPPAQVDRLIRQSAACGGQHIASTTGHDAATALQSLLTNPIPDLPDAQSLGQLLEGRETRSRLLAVYLGGFLLVFSLLLLMPQLRVTAMAFSVLTTALAGFLWDKDYRSTFVAWGEMATGHRVARYAGLERATATGRGEQTVQLQSLALSPIRVTGNSLVLRWSDDPGNRRAAWSAALLQEMQVFSLGSFHAESRLRAGAGGTGLVVCNRSDGTAPAAYLRWQDDNYTIPPLAPGERWFTDDRSITDEVSPHLDLLARRAADLEPTILYPLEIPGNGRDQQAWLMTVEVAWEDAPCIG
jgi:hypothetical protein